MAEETSPSEESNPQYQYAALPSARTFRVIKFLPPRRSWFRKETLRFELVEVDVDAPIAYDCLSYTWGVGDGDVPDRKILIHSGNQEYGLHIHKPLEDALLQLSHSGFTDMPLFVDQICLNQQDGAEKAVQVPLMRNIYTNCQRTMCWLGIGNRLTNRYFDVIRVLNHAGILGRLVGPNRGHFMQVWDHLIGGDEVTSELILQDIADLRALLDLYIDNFPLRAMEEVLQSDWFSRLWIVQEACLSPDVVFVCGAQSLCLDCWRGGLLFYTVWRSYVNKIEGKKIAKTEIALSWRLNELQQGFLRLSVERKKLHLLQQRSTGLQAVLRYSIKDGGRPLGARRAEDRIFALMGLMIPEDPAANMAVRYNDVRGVFTQFAALQVLTNIDVLCYAQFPKKQENLPSWVPDWTMSLRLAGGYTKMEEPRFAASIGLEPNTQVDETEGILHVNGLRIGRIARIGSLRVEQQTRPETAGQVEAESAKLFFDEMDELIRYARQIPNNRFDQDRPTDLDREDAAVDLADFGLSRRYMQGNLEPDAIKRGLRAAKAQAYRVGKRQIDAAEKVRSYHIDSIFATIGIIPWYWVPAGDVDLLHSLAIDPVRASWRWCVGAAGFVVDVLGMMTASTITTTFPHLLRLRQRFWTTYMVLNPVNKDEHLRSHGLDANIEHSEAVSAFYDFLVKTEGGKVFVTKEGFVGQAIGDVREGDTVVVLGSATTPFVLRSKQGEVMANEDQSQHMWEYIGEAYVDGIMDGELSTEAGTVERFSIG